MHFWLPVSQVLVERKVLQLVWCQPCSLPLHRTQVGHAGRTQTCWCQVPGSWLGIPRMPGSRFGGQVQDHILEWMECQDLFAEVTHDGDSICQCQRHWQMLSP